MQDLHQVVLSNISDTVLITDDAGALTFVCPNVSVIFGYSVAEVRRLGNIAHLLGDDLFDSRELDAGGGIHNIERTITDKAGREHVLLVTVKRVSVDGGTTLYTCRDITERMRIEEALRESEKKHRTLFETMAQGVVYQNADGEITSANPAAERILGLSLDQMRGRTSVDTRWRAIHDDGTDFPGDTHPAMVALRTGEEVRDVVMGVFNPKQEAYTWININAIPLFRPRETEPYQVYTAFEDITERKRSIEALRGSEERYRTLFDGAPVALFRTTPDGSILDVNPSTVDMIGYPDRTSLLAANVLDHYVDPERRRQWQRIVAREGSVDDFEVRLRRHDGEIIWGLLSLRAIRNEAGEVVHYEGSLKDVTDRKRAEEQLRRQAARNQVLADISRKLAAASLDNQAVLDTITQHLAETIGDACVLARLSDDGQWVRPVAFHHPDPKARAIMQDILAGSVERLGEAPTSSILDSGETLLIPETSPDEVRDLLHPAYEPWLDQVGLYSLLIVPLRVQDTIIGTLGLSRDRPGKPYTAEDRVLLQDLADRAALAIRNANLFEAEQRARRTAETLRAANVALTETLDLDAVLERLLDHLHQLVPYDSAGILFKEADSRLAVRATRGYEDWSEPDAVRNIVVEAQALPHFRELVTQRQSVLIPNTAQDPGWRDDLPGTEHIANWLGVPLIAGGEVIGVYGLDKAEPNFFTPEHAKLAETLAGQAAVAIQNARLFEQVRVGRERLQSLSERLVDVQETERRHIARELHDEIGQLLTGLKLTLDMMPALPATAGKNLNEARGLANELMARVRQMSLDLRPAMLDDLGLLPALLWHFERYAALTNVHVNFKHRGIEDRRFTPEIETAAYRITQEALTNVARHAGVDEVTVRVWTDADILGLQIEDRGAGFDAPAALAAETTGGLSGMYERAVLTGGKLDIESTPGAGTCLTVEFPLAGRLERRTQERQG